MRSRTYNFYTYYYTYSILICERLGRAAKCLNLINIYYDATTRRRRRQQNSICLHLFAWRNDGSQKLRIYIARAPSSSSSSCEQSITTSCTIKKNFTMLNYTYSETHTLPARLQKFEASRRAIFFLVIYTIHTYIMYMRAR